MYTVHVCISVPITSATTGLMPTSMSTKPEGPPGSDLDGPTDDDDDDDDYYEDDDSGSSAGLAIGVIMAVMTAAACTAAVLYRRKKRGRKSTYITFGNPSYSREHLPANDFSLDSPLTLSSNGYTVLA